MNVWTILAFVLYLGAMLYIGFLFSKKSNNVGDYFLGGRGMGSWLTALSAQASDMSSWLLMGLPGAVYLSGLGEAWIAVGLGIGTYLNWLLVAKRLRNYSYVTGDAITIPEYFQNRFNAKSTALRVTCAIIIFIFFLVYTASSFNAAAKLLQTVFGIQYQVGLLIGVVVIMAYTFMGGYFAVVWTDFFQGMLMFFALLIVPIVAYAFIKADFSSVVSEMPGYMNFLKESDGSTSTWQYVVSNLGWGLGYFGMPHILLRFMGTEDENKLKLSRRIATIWVIISMFIAIFIGIVGYSISKAGHIPAFTDSSQSETLIIKIAMLLSNHGVIAIIFAGIILAGILACTMSTSDSQLLAASSSVSHNLLHDVLHIELSEKASMLVARITVICIAVIGVFIARDPESSVFAIVSFAWAGFGASFGPIMLFSLFWKRTNRNGALAGMLVGGIMVFVWKYLIKPLGGIWGIYELLPAFLCACIAIVVVSLLTAPPSKEIIDEFESVGK